MATDDVRALAASRAGNAVRYPARTRSWPARQAAVSRTIVRRGGGERGAVIRVFQVVLTTTVIGGAAPLLLPLKSPREGLEPVLSWC
jgi:hypothetical protein